MHHILIVGHRRTNKYAQKRQEKKTRCIWHFSVLFPFQCRHQNDSRNRISFVVYDFEGCFFSLFRWPNNRFWPFPKQIDFAFYFQTRSFTVIKYSLKRRRFFYASVQNMARIPWNMEWRVWWVGVRFFFLTWFMWHMLAVQSISDWCKTPFTNIVCDLFLFYFFFFIFFKRENFTHICWKKGTNRQKKGFHRNFLMAAYFFTMHTLLRSFSGWLLPKCLEQNQPSLGNSNQFFPLFYDWDKRNTPKY